MTTAIELLQENGINLSDEMVIALFERSSENEHGKISYEPLGEIKKDSAILHRPLPFAENEKMIAGEIHNKRYGYASFRIVTNDNKIRIMSHD